MTSSSRPPPPYVSRAPPVDTFTFSDEIEQELAAMDGGGVGDTIAAAPTQSSYVSSAALSATAAATRAAVANPQAYAEAHFGGRSAAPTAAALSYAQPTANGSGGGSGGGRPSTGRPLSIDAVRAERSAPHSRASLNPSSLSHAASAGVSYSSGVVASPSTDEQHKAFYDDDAHYFNLGASSFPLLPHNSVYDDELLAAEQAQAGGGRTPRGGAEQTFSPSGRVHAQHFTSILNQPASRLQHAAGPAIVSASGFLPSLASIWTFTTGVQPPEAVARVSDDLLSFSEDAPFGEHTPFVLPPCPPLDEAVGENCVAAVSALLRSMQPHAATYMRNHPRASFKERAAALKSQEHGKVHAASIRSQLARERARTKALRHTHRQHNQLRGIAEAPSDSDADVSDEDRSSAPSAHASASSSSSSLLAAASPSLLPDSADASAADVDDAEDAASKLSLARDLRKCYSSVPPEYFSPDFQLSSLEFWRNAQDLEWVTERTHGPASSSSPDDPHSPGGSTSINPYSSFNALSSYHSSQGFKLPSLAEQKAAQLKAYRATQQRLERMASLNEHHARLQVELGAHLDHVEVTLLHQIAAKSHVFFTGLDAVKSIQMEVSQALATIAQLRAKVGSLKSSLSEAGMGVLVQVRRQSRARETLRVLELVEEVLSTPQHIQSLILAGDFAGAMDLLNSTRRGMDRELRGVTCIEHVRVKMQEHAKIIGQLMQMEFVGVAIRGAQFYLHDTSSAADGAAKSSSSSSSSSSRSSKLVSACPNRTLSTEEQERLVPLAAHLIDLGQLDHTFTSVLKEELQNILKARVTDFVGVLLAKSESAEGAHTDKAEGQQQQQHEDAANSILNDPPTQPASSLAPPMPAASESPAPATAVAVASTPSPQPAAAVSPAPIAAPVAAPVAAPARRAANVAMPVGAQAPAATAVASSNATIAAPAAPAPSSVNASSPAPPSSSPSPAPTSSPAAVAPAAAAAPAPAAPSLATRLASLPHDEFLSLLLPLFTSLMDLLQRASTVRHLALTVLANASLTPAQKEPLSRTINECILTLVEFVHAKIGKILQARASVHASHLDLKSLRHFMNLILHFIQEGERLADKTLYGLRGVLLVQAKAFMAAFHQQALTQLGHALETEKWVRVEVPDEYQTLIDSHFAVPKADKAGTSTAATAPQQQQQQGAAAPVPSSPVDSISDAPSRSATATPSATAVTPSKPAWQNKSWNDADEQDGEEENKGDGKHAGTSSASTAPATPAKSDESATSSVAAPTPDAKRVLFVSRPSPTGGPVTFLRFPVVHSLLVLLKLMGQYAECASQLQAVGSDILTKLTELLQMFNSRSCQLVLGAGAMHLSGLKSITASHLALAAQSVGLLVSQIPVLRSVLASRLPAKHHVLLHQLDRVSRDCQEHQREIFAKLVAIMDELIKYMRDKLEALPWAQQEAATAAVSGGAPHASASVASSPSPTLSSSSSSSSDPPKVDDCVRTLMKQTCSLHRALSDLLLAEQRDLVFRDISHMFVRHVREITGKLDMHKHSVKTKLALDVGHMHSRLSTCVGVDEAALQQLHALVA